MGTRNLTMVILDGKMVVGQYCQWDGYPSGQGVNILTFLRKKFNREKFLEGLKASRFITPKEHYALYEQVLGYIPGDYIDVDDSKKFGLVYPSLNRDLGGKILEFIQEREIAIEQVEFKPGTFTALELPDLIVKATPEIPLKNGADNLDDASWCEWAYQVNLDTNEFFVYEGAKTQVAKWKLNKLPTEKAFLKKLGSE